MVSNMRVVVKIGGSIIDEDLTNIAEDTQSLFEKGHEIVMVHGGAKIVSRLSEQLGKKPEFITSPAGIRSRYTDRETIEIFIKAIAGEANKALVQLFLQHNIPAIGISGFDGKIIQAKRKKKLKIQQGGKILLIDGGFTGKITKIDTQFLKLILEGKFLPVVATLAASEELEPLNIDGDEAARHIAQAIQADQFVILTDVPGVLDKENKLISNIKRGQLDHEIARVTVGMKRKLMSINSALSEGLNKVSIASGLVPNPLSKALKGENCTVIE